MTGIPNQTCFPFWFSVIQGLNWIPLPSFLPNFWSRVKLKKFKKNKFGHVSGLGSKLASAIELGFWALISDVLKVMEGN